MSGSEVSNNNLDRH